MNKKTILKKLRDDENYYGSFGKKFLSNSDIGTLLSNPLALGSEVKSSPAILIGRYFHTALLEPDKLKDFKVIAAATRNTKVYKDESEGELCLLQGEVDMVKLMTDKILDTQMCVDLINKKNCEYEVPMITELFGNKWKGKADVVNNEEELVIDLKTTADINKFRTSAFRYNYDSQAYIYKELFGYDFIFIVIDKSTNQIGLFECSEEFLQSGKTKVKKASDVYDLFFKDKDFDPSQYFISETL
jgi:hypothetical protein|tara:strand:- start:1040 stop:1771 length:732 start_codon:yes stop_codon:yes gene_type:complete